MATTILVGELISENTPIPVHVSLELYRRVAATSAKYTGHSDPADRCLALVAALDQAVTAGQTTFGHQIDDNDWSGDPDLIEQTRLNIAITRSPGKITLCTNLRRITKINPEYSKIAANALASIKNYQARFLA